MKVMSAIERCRTAALGGHVARCENDACGHTLVAYNSCRNRHCPKCQGAAARQWLAEREAELLPSATSMSSTRCRPGRNWSYVWSTGSVCVLLKLGLQTFDQHLFDLYEAQQISYEDALRNADSVNELRLMIKLHGKEAKEKDLSTGIEHLNIV